MKVKAHKMGFYKSQRVRAGQVFELDSKDQFSVSWMIPMDEESKVIAEGLSKELGEPVKSKPLDHEVAEREAIEKHKDQMDGLSKQGAMDAIAQPEIAEVLTEAKEEVEAPSDSEVI